MPPAKHGCECVCVCMWGGGGFRLRCKMDSYIFMNSVRKVKRKQYDNLAVIAFFPLPTVFWQSCEPLPETYDGDRVRQRSVTAVTVRYTLTPYPRPVNPARGQVVVLPNPSALWVMGWLSLVLRWPVICLINQYRQQIIELLTGLSELHLSSDPARARRTKSNQMCLGLWCPDIISFYSPDSFIWHPDLWLKATPRPQETPPKAYKKTEKHPKGHISNYQAFFPLIHVSLLDTCQQPSEKCWHRCPPVRQHAPSVWTWI